MKSTAKCGAELESVHMQPLKPEGRAYEVESRAYHAARPGFRIAEMQIGPTQTIPWHYHTQVQDTFYVINGTIRLSAREPEEEVCLTVGMTYSVRPGRPHLVANAGNISAVFLVLQGMGEHDFVPLA
jgi:mannose-6-phosphate isomerase-like protein (cupin superfamily)